MKYIKEVKRLDTISGDINEDGCLDDTKESREIKMLPHLANNVGEIKIGKVFNKIKLSFAECP